MPEITSNSVACCVTDIGTGRIWWEWRQGHWVIAANLPLRLPRSATALSATVSRDPFRLEQSSACGSELGSRPQFILGDTHHENGMIGGGAAPSRSRLSQS
jgi:hypothetical protein